MTNKPNEPIEAAVEITKDDCYPALWVRLFDEMIENGITFGTQYFIGYLEERLALKADSMAFGVAIAAINDELSASGLYLSARDQGGAGYLVLLEEGAEMIAQARVRRSFREMHRAQALFGGIARNPAAKISQQTRDRLLKCEEKAAFRLALMRAPMKALKTLPTIKNTNSPTNPINAPE